jgi:lipopolysaccharide/colanic/teichoic acid biosynthesis glycosyltransferase
MGIAVSIEPANMPTTVTDRPPHAPSSAADQHAPAHRWRPPSSLLRFRSFFYLLALDCLAIFVPFAIAAGVRGVLGSDPGWLVFAAIAVPVYAIAATNVGAYTTYTLQDPFRAIRRAEQALLLAIATVTLVAFYLKSSETFARLTIAIGSVGSAFLLAVIRYWFVRNIATIVGGNPFSAILIQDGEQSIPPGEFSLIMPAGDYFDPDRHDPVMYDRLATMLSTADRVVVMCPPERRVGWARALQGANIQGEIAMPELAALSPLGMNAKGAVPAVIVATGPLNLLDRFIKRAFDVTVASLALLALLPLFVVVAIAIKFDSSGPVLFRQTRIGRGNQMFEMFKFRSMFTDELDGAGHRSASRDDDRITNVGRLIRRTSIDELPQLVNVLRGDMSVVGPRPHALGSRAADKLFWEVDRRYWDRHAAKPGLTGLAQVRGFRGATLVEDDLRNRLQADLEYLEHWSIWRDIKIIFLTVRVVLHRNAF